MAASWCMYESKPTGALVLVSEDGALTGCWFGTGRSCAAGLPADARRVAVSGGAPADACADVGVDIPGAVSAGGQDGVPDADEACLTAACAWLGRYCAGDRPQPVDLSLAPRGTEFQRAVWKALLQIPYGQVVTYGAVAAQVEQETGRRTLARAVGGAVGCNPLGIIVPCHRVVGANGALTGFAGGLERKVALLEHEGLDVAHLGEALAR